MKRRLTGILTVFCLSLVAACAFAPEREIITTKLIDAPPADVWAVLIDGPSYADWNPFIVQMDGDVTAGAMLTNTIQPTGGDAMTFTPEVLVARQDHELRWLGRFILPGIFDGEHYFVLTPEGEATRLVHGEKFDGIALWFMDVEPFKANFSAMNDALAKEVQARALR